MWLQRLVFHNYYNYKCSLFKRVEEILHQVGILEFVLLFCRYFYQLLAVDSCPHK